MSSHKQRDDYNAYMREYMQGRWVKRRKLAIELMGGKCVRCGDKENLEFDHIHRADKTYNISSSTALANAKFWPELQKCQLLCKPCHRNKSNTELSVEHGGGKAGKKNCACDPCRERRKAYNQEYLATHPRNRKKSGGVV